MPGTIYAENDEEDLFDLRDERPLSRARKPLPWLRMVVFSALCIAALAYLAQEATEASPGSPKPIPATVLIAPPPPWQVVNPANSPFSLDKNLGLATATARQHSGGGREDTLVVGAPGEARYARVTFSHGLPITPRSLYVDVVRRAAEAGLSVERNGLSGLLVTKFGSLESASITLGGPAEQNCQAFRFHGPDSVFGFQGWLCGQDAQPVEKADLACFIDNMTLSGAAEIGLKALFARTEKARSETCPPPARTASAVKPQGRP
jgi:hypothetical protein